MDLDVLYEIDVPRPWPGPHPHGRRGAEQRAYREAVRGPLPDGVRGKIRLADRMGFRRVWAVATVDVLSGGRGEWGTGRSTPMEQAAFGVDRERSREDWREAIVIVAGAAGLGLLSFSITQPLDAMARQVAAYRAACRDPRPLTGVTTDRVGACTLVHATAPGARPDARVWDSVAWWYANLARFTLEWELPHLAPEEREQAFPLLAPILEGDVPVREFGDGDMILIGDAETIVTKAERYADLGVDQLIRSVQWGYLEHRENLRTIEILGKEVIPELARYVPRRAA
ncbi:LLM class flavin-dependent oxidoreductase [Streptomyces virginiae]